MAELSAEKEKMRRWLDAWDVADREMDALKTSELQALSEEEAARRFDELSLPTKTLWFSPERMNSEGLVEQQRIFQRVTFNNYIGLCSPTRRSRRLGEHR